MEKLFALESIAHQSSAFFDDLVKACKNIRATAVAGKDGDFFAQPQVQQIPEIIRRYTQLKVEWDPAFTDYGPIMLTPIYTLNHTFFSTADRQDREPHLSAGEFIKRMSKPLYQGTIDLGNAKVTGDFTEFPQRLALPQSLLLLGRWRDEELSCEEVAATLLHEVGHAFIELEFLDRAVTTNQILAGLSVALLETEPEQKKLAYSTAALRMRLTPAQQKALEAAQNDDSLTVIMATLAVEQSRSELGESVFDQTACEHLADQFAARHGAAQSLITVLAKIERRNPEAGYNWRWTRDVVLYGLGGLVLLPITLLVLFSVHLAEDRYGSLHSRTTRIRGEIVNRLKNRAITDDERKQLLEALATADKLLDSESPKLSFFEGVAYYVNSQYRHNHDYRLLQQKLESYANNNLFGQAARLAAL